MNDEHGSGGRHEEKTRNEAPVQPQRRHFFAATLAWVGALVGRSILGGSLLGASNCGALPNTRPNGGDDGLLYPTPACEPTASDILGPFHRPGAPMRTDLTGGEPIEGVALEVSGQVLTTNCRPVEGALLDVWQADDDGRYDNDGQDDPPDQAFVLRGRMRTDPDGRYRFTTIVPGRYLNGPTYRPTHLHAILTADGHRALTTQLYFPGDPFNESDAFFKPELLMAVDDEADGSRTARFDFVL